MRTLNVITRILRLSRAAAPGGTDRASAFLLRHVHWAQWNRPPDWVPAFLGSVCLATRGAKAQVAELALAAAHVEGVGRQVEGRGGAGRGEQVGRTGRGGGARTGGGGGRPCAAA